MSSKFELLYNQLSEDQINQIIQGLRGEQPMNNDIEVDEQLVNNEKMASYSQGVSGNNRQDKNQDTDDTNEHNNQFPKQGYTQSHYRESENVKPIFLKDVFGSRKPERSLWLTNVEIYKAIGDKVQAQCIKGIQCVREMWRIYMDNEEDRQSLLVQRINLRGRQIPLHLQNPHNPSRYQPDTIRIKIKNVPLSADDGQIDRALAMEGCEIQGIFRDRLRVDGKLTNCETGDRLVISKLLSKPIPRMLKIGKYIARVFHPGQPEFQNRNYTQDSDKTCHKCLTPGHFIYDCPNDWVCRKCHESGHKMMDCSKDFNVENSEPEQHHAGTDDRQDDETKQDDSKGRKTNKQSHVDVDVTITNKNKSTKASTKEASSTKGNINKPEPAKDSPRKVRTTNNKNTEKSEKGQHSIQTFLKTPGNTNKQNVRNHTPPTHTERLYDRNSDSNGPKKAKTADGKSN